MRHQTTIRWLALGVLLTLFGCSKPATSDTDNSSSEGSSATSNAKEKERKGGERRAEPVRPIVVEAGTALEVTVDQSISSKTNNPGDQFDCSIASPVTVNGREVIPVGAKCTGTVTDAKSAGRFKGGAMLGVALSSVTVHGQTYPIHTTGFEEAGKGRGKRTAIGAGGGAAVGAIIGAIAGGGKGAAIGAAAGGGAGTAGAALTGKRDITIPAETRLSFKLAQPLELKPR
jgi:hypothetical protein